MAAPSRNAQLLTPEELAGRLDELYRALDEFNDGYYFEAHETLEDLWLVTPLPERTLFQGIIQLAAAYVHLARGEVSGAIKLLDAAVAKLRPFEPEALGIDVAAMAEEAAGVKLRLASDGASPSIRAALAASPRWRYTRHSAG
jgi:predicted metal-dependent hydrolase